jgi:hypothetical protein
MHLLYLLLRHLSSAAERVHRIKFLDINAGYPFPGQMTDSCPRTMLVGVPVTRSPAWASPAVTRGLRKRKAAPAIGTSLGGPASRRGIHHEDLASRIAPAHWTFMAARKIVPVGKVIFSAV